MSKKPLTPGRAFAELVVVCCVCLFLLFSIGVVWAFLSSDSPSPPLDEIIYIPPSKSDLLVGTWRTVTKEGYHVQTTYSADGTYSGQCNTNSWGILIPQVIIASGTWRIEGEQLITTCTKSTYADEQFSGLATIYQIISIDETKLVLRGSDREGGLTTSTYYREK